MSDTTDTSDPSDTNETGGPAATGRTGGDAAAPFELRETGEMQVRDAS